MKNCVVVVNGKDYFGTYDPKDRMYTARRVAGEAVAKSGIVTTRRNPVAIQATLSDIEVKDFKQVRVRPQVFSILPPLRQMTGSEFEEDSAEALKPIPHEFHDPLKHMAYERGHSSGYEEVLNCLRDLTTTLEAPIKAYGARCARESKLNQ